MHYEFHRFINWFVIEEEQKISRQIDKEDNEERRSESKNKGKQKEVPSVCY